MVSLQILSKVLQTGNKSLITDNMLTEEYFLGYEQEYQFIKDHIQTYGNVPDIATFLAKFPKMELVDVSESDDYLVDAIREEYLFNQSSEVLNNYAKLLKTDSNAATEYMRQQLKNTLVPNYRIGGVDIVSQAKQRYEKYQEIKNNPESWFFESGFRELDDIIQGIKREEEFFVIFARTNHGKSWLLEKIIAHIWGLGFNVGYFSPEMSDTSIGFRFDTLTQHFSNSSLARGKSDIDEQAYGDYIDKLSKKKNKFMVANSQHFGNSVTVGKIRQWIIKDKLDAVAIDGLVYMSDERGQRKDNVSTTLTHISEDLMALSVEMHVPILAVVQANREGVRQDDNDDVPDIENIKDSDGISHNASTILAIRQKGNVLVIVVKKKRDGTKGGKLTYTWNINTGEFTFIPANDDARPKSETDKQVKATKQKYEKDNVDVF